MSNNTANQAKQTEPKVTYVLQLTKEELEQLNHLLNQIPLGHIINTVDYLRAIQQKRALEKQLAALNEEEARHQLSDAKVTEKATSELTGEYHYEGKQSEFGDKVKKKISRGNEEEDAENTLREESHFK